MGLAVHGRGGAPRLVGERRCRRSLGSSTARRRGPLQLAPGDGHRPPQRRDLHRRHGEPRHPADEPGRGADHHHRRDGEQARRFGRPARGACAGDRRCPAPGTSPFCPTRRRARRSKPGSHEDLHDDRGLLFIAMAGTHQIWVLDLERGLLMPFAGTGREALVDGPRETACFAQPSGLALDPEGRRLFVADSETSAIAPDRPRHGGGLHPARRRALRVRRRRRGARGGPPAAPPGRRLLGGRPGGPVTPGRGHLQPPHQAPRSGPAHGAARSPGRGRPGASPTARRRPARFSEPGGLSLARGTLVRRRHEQPPRAGASTWRRGDGRSALAVGTLEIDLSRRAHEPPPQA